MCDAHLRLRVEEVGTQLIKVLEVSKVRGAAKSTGNIISFDVEPNLGMRIIPVTKAKA
jgi:flagellar protein FlaH